MAVQSNIQARKLPRSSNLELYRIVVMLLIVAHHYVGNSGLIQLAYAEPTTIRSLFLLILSAFGKPGINCFVLITGYFMCRSQITTRKFLKLLVEVYFYRVVIYAIFVVTGYERLSLKLLVKLILPMTALQANFTGCFLLFYLFIPFLNILLKHLGEKKHLLLIGMCLLVYTVFGGFDGLSFFPVEMNYVSWFIVLYFIGSYFRLYPKKLFDNTKIWGWMTLVSVALAVVSVVVGAWLGKRLGQPQYAHFAVNDCNKLLALMIGISSFLFFKSLKIRHSKFINILGGSTFGVMLIHSHSHSMRAWLWVDLLKSPTMYASQWLFLHAVCSVIGVFAVCTVLDCVRIRFVEKPFFDALDNHWEAISRPIRRFGRNLCSKLGVAE